MACNGTGVTPEAMRTPSRHEQRRMQQGNTHIHAHTCAIRNLHIDRSHTKQERDYFIMRNQQIAWGATRPKERKQEKIDAETRTRNAEKERIKDVHEIHPKTVSPSNFDSAGCSKFLRPFVMLYLKNRNLNLYLSSSASTCLWNLMSKQYPEPRLTCNALNP